MYIEILLKELEKCCKYKDVPVSALIVKNGKIIAKSYNKKEKNKNPFNHAEILVINKVCKKIKSYNLSDCDLYVTLKPCEMCQALINASKIKNVYYLVDKLDYKKEYKSNYYLIEGYDDLKKKYKNVLKDFFESLRNQINKN